MVEKNVKKWITSKSRKENKWRLETYRKYISIFVISARKNARFQRGSYQSKKKQKTPDSKYKVEKKNVKRNGKDPSRMLKPPLGVGWVQTPIPLLAGNIKKAEGKKKRSVTIPLSSPPLNRDLGRAYRSPKLPLKPTSATRAYSSTV